MKATYTKPQTAMMNIEAQGSILELILDSPSGPEFAAPRRGDYIPGGGKVGGKGA